MFIQQTQFQKLNDLTQKKLLTKCFLGKMIWLVLFVTLINSPLASAERIKELASIQGVRQNQLIGYGIVVGLDGTGDQSPVTVQGITNMLTQMGINTPAGANLQAKNVAGVVVTANLPSFAQPGQTLDITVSSVGAAKSLRGGTLLMTPLKGADGQIYAMAQGNLLVGGAGAAADDGAVGRRAGRAARRAGTGRPDRAGGDLGRDAARHRHRLSRATRAEAVWWIRHDRGSTRVAGYPQGVPRAADPEPGV